MDGLWCEIYIVALHTSGRELYWILTARGRWGPFTWTWCERRGIHRGLKVLLKMHWDFYISVNMWESRRQAHSCKCAENYCLQFSTRSGVMAVKENGCGSCVMLPPEEKSFCLMKDMLEKLSRGGDLFIHAPLWRLGFKIKGIHSITAAPTVRRMWSYLVVLQAVPFWLFWYTPKRSSEWGAWHHKVWGRGVCCSTVTQRTRAAGDR